MHNQYQTPSNTGDEAAAQAAADEAALKKAEEGLTFDKKEEGQDDTNKNTDGAGEQDVLYAGEFKSIEELEKSYAELKKAQSGEQKDTQTDSQGDEDSQKDADDKSSVSDNVDEDKDSDSSNEKFDIDSVVKTYIEGDNKLTDEQYTLYEKQGYSKDQVDRLIKGEMAVAQQTVAEIVGTIGGEDNYKAAVEWASENLSQEEIDAFGDVINNSKNLPLMKMAVQGLYARFAASNTDPKLLEGNQTSGGTTGYKTWNEYMSAVRDERYDKDAAYRESVDARLRKSKF